MSEQMSEVTQPSIHTPPQPAQRPVTSTYHGDERVDEYAWLRDKDDPDVIAHLEAENAYTDSMLAHLGGLRDELYEEFRSRTQETDEQVPYPDGAWEYVSRTVEGKQYSIYSRRPLGGGDEQTVLDPNELAEGLDYFSLGAFAVSPTGDLLAYATDTDGSERLHLYVKDLRTGELLPDTIDNCGYGAAWSADEQYVFYTTVDENTRPYKLWRHKLGTDPSADVLLHTEDDEAYFMSVRRTRSREWLVMSLGASITSEVRVLPADDPEGEWRLVAERRTGVEYFVDHHGERFLIVTNDEGPDFRVAQAPVTAPGPDNWTDLIPHTPGVRIEGIDPFASQLVVSLRAEGRTELDVLEVDSGERRRLAFDEPIYTVGLGVNREFDTSVVRVEYTSMTTPPSTIDVDLVSDAREVRKVQPVLGVDLSQYESARSWATASDGTRIPMSFVWRKDRVQGGPAVLYGYGSYEISYDPSFSTERLSLLDRGVAFGIAHIRGGGEMGRAWYEHGKKLEKVNSFTDFVACAEQLVKDGWTTPAQLGIRGGSAGGLLMGAVLNLRPDLFAGVLAQVPFVDALNTMLDPSLPLTVREWDEWGNPIEDPETYAAMKAYAPYENVAKGNYPRVLATGGLNDPRVGFWEPAKWVARLRDRLTGGGPILLKTELGAGHAGPSGRYNRWKDEALNQSFLLDAIGIARRDG